MMLSVDFKMKKMKKCKITDRLQESEILCDFARFMLLTLLYDEPETAHALQKKFQERFHRNISISFVYNFLNDLKQQGIVCQQVFISTENKKRKFFVLTEEGRQLYEKTLQTFLKISRSPLRRYLVECTRCNVIIYLKESESIELVEKSDFCCVSCEKHHLEVLVS